MKDPRAALFNFKPEMYHVKIPEIDTEFLVKQPSAKEWGDILTGSKIKHNGDVLTQVIINLSYKVDEPTKKAFQITDEEAIEKNISWFPAIVDLWDKIEEWTGKKTSEKKINKSLEQMISSLVHTTIAKHLKSIPLNSNTPIQDKSKED